MESFDQRIRATIDQDLSYYSIGQNEIYPAATKDNAIILEIKYDQNDSDIAEDCVQAIPYRLTKNSKYVSGMQLHLQ